MQNAPQLIVAAALLAIGSTATAQSRDQISIVGSSTVYPFTTVVAEQFGKSTSFKTPKVESTGTGGGFKLFCGGVGVQHPDITGASRAIKKSEVESCAKNGVTDITEVKIGFDGITVAHSKSAPDFGLSRQELYWALAKQVPDQSGTKLIDNPYRTWKDINARLPAVKIEVLGPPPTSGTRDAFLELVMDVGCKDYPVIKAMDSKAARAACQTIREDGAYVEAGENDNLIVQKLEANPNAVGIFGYSFLEQNMDKLQGVPIEGVRPEFDNIASGKYNISRSLYFYVKNAHAGVIPGLREFVAEFVSNRAGGSEGYLAERGLIPLPDAERQKVAQQAMSLVPMAKD